MEAWLPEADRAGGAGQLVLSRGPLSYEYGLFKIELHSAAASTAVAGSSNRQQSASAQSPAAALSSSTANELDDSKSTDAATRGGGRRRGGKDEAEADEDQDEDDYSRSGPKSSEHLIDGRSFDAELQLHFYNKRLASSAAEAQQLAGQDEGRPSLFAAISVFLISAAAAASGEQPSATRLLVDELMLNNLSSLENQGDSVELTVERQQIERLVPDRRHYISYQGSMNRPPCSESVDWILVNRPLRMDSGKFRQLYEKLNTNQENIRPVKPLNRRLLRTTINDLVHKQRQQNANTPAIEPQPQSPRSAATKEGRQPTWNCSTNGGGGGSEVSRQRSISGQPTGALV